MPEQAHLTVTSRLEELDTVQQWFGTLMNQLSGDLPWLGQQFDRLNLALAEGFTNAVRHAHAELPQSTPIELALSWQPERIEICIFDQGPPFNPDSLSEPKPGALREGGYGWFLMRKLADHVTYDRLVSASARPLPSVASEPPLPKTEHSHPKNCLRIVKTSQIV